mgnify:CR=1 FL=1
MELNELIESIDIVEYVSQFVELEEKNGEYWGLSPFRDENTPSFSVRRESGRFYDFSSGIGGNVFTFVKHYNHCSAKEAVEILKKYAGCDGESVVPRKKLAATIACKKFKSVQQHKKSSVITVYPDNCMEKYEKKDEKLAAWETEGISRASLDKFQVYYDSFSNRLVYPIRNINGQIVNIGGRTLDPDFKAKKLRKYTYFSGWNGNMNVIPGLFENLNEILKAKEVIIFEGIKSVMLADTYGIKTTGCILTSHLNPEQVKILAKLGCDVVFALDKDVEIINDHNINRLKRYVKVYYIKDCFNLTEEKDSPIDKGYDIFKQLYDKRRWLR